jgi:hypothetical protein
VWMPALWAKAAAPVIVFVEGDAYASRLGNKRLDAREAIHAVLGQHVLAVRDDHASNKAAQGGDAVALADSEHGRVDECGARLDCAEGVGHGATRVVMEVRLDGALHSAPQTGDEAGDLARRCAAHRVGDANAVHAESVDRRVEIEELALVAPEGVFGGETHFEPGRKQVAEHVVGHFRDLGHGFLIRVLSQLRRSPNEHVPSTFT